MEYDYRLLSQEEVFGDAKTDVIKTTGAECAVSDFAVVSGAYISDGRTCMWFLSSSSDYGDVCAVDRDGSSRMAYPDSRGGMRPVMECADISQLDCSTARDISGFEEVEYGEYPQSAADRELAGVLEQEFSEGRLIKTGKRYCSQYDEFQHEGGKYIRALYIPEKTQQLSNGKKYSSGDIVWLKVSQLKWLYDAKAGLLISRTIPAAGLRFSHGKYYDGDFEKTDMCRYLNTTFADDIVPVVLRELTPEEKAMYEEDAGRAAGRRNPYGLTFGEVTEEDIIRGAVESDVAVFLHGPSSEGKSARVKQIDPECEIIYLRNATPDSLNGRSVYNQATGEMIDIPPVWFRKVKEKCELLNRYNIPIWVMEPIRGGKLANLPESMTAELRAMRPEASAASWALRWVQQIPGVTMILSGMSDLAQMEDNLATFDHPQPLSEEETACLLRFAEQMKNAVPCTACRYCCDGCPQRINIPQMLRVLNEIRIAPSTNAIMAVEALPESQQPSACLGCGACAAICPQKIDIPGCMQELTERIAKIPSWAEISRQRAAAQP